MAATCGERVKELIDEVKAKHGMDLSDAWLVWRALDIAVTTIRGVSYSPMGEIDMGAAVKLAELILARAKEVEDGTD